MTSTPTTRIPGGGREPTPPAGFAPDPSAGAALRRQADGSARRRDRRGGRRRSSLLLRLGAGGCAVLLVAAVASVVLTRVAAGRDAVVCGDDAVQAEAVAGLADFASWLQANQVPGYIGEVGWPSAGPDAGRWAAAADTWYRAADALGLPVTAWAAGRWPADYPMAVYRASSGATSLDSAGPQSQVTQAHGRSAGAARGVVVASGSFGTSDSSPRYSAASPGRYGHDYGYENQQSYRYLASQGVRLVRLAVAWERLQPHPGGPLRAEEVGRLRRAARQAEQAGLWVIIDLHGYGEFVLTADGTSRTVLSLGSPQLPTSMLADFWSRLARATQDLPGLRGYDLLNEPSRLAGRGAQGVRIWEQASQESVDAIRATGNRQPVFVGAYGRSAALGWSREHERPWVHDPAGRVVYEAQVYFDADGSGRYADSYSGALATAGADDLPRCHRLPDLRELDARVLGGQSPWWRPRLFGLADRVSSPTASGNRPVWSGRSPR